MSAHDEAIDEIKRNRCWSDMTPEGVIVDAYLTAMAERGFKLTPREATEEMRDAYWAVDEVDAAKDWQAMWDAVPDVRGGE